MRRLKVVEEVAPRSSNRVALISVTTFCNARCDFCCVLDILNKPELNPTDERILGDIERQRAAGCTVLSFTGGEPTLHPRFADFCARGRELGYESITINTNGMRFQDRRFTSAALDAGLSNIDFSIHGHDAELHDRMMVRKGAFDAFLRGIQNVKELAAGRPIGLGSTTVVTTENAPHLTAIVDLLCDVGITSLRLKHCYSAARTSELGLVPQYEAYMAAVRAAVRRVRERGPMVSVTHFPLCLLGEEAAFATDFIEESVLSIDTRGEVIADGRASMHRRASAKPCQRCALAGTCTQLDANYEIELGDVALQPFETRHDVARFVGDALSTYPSDDLRAWLRTQMQRPIERHEKPAGEMSMENRMSIGFISPTFRVLELNWEHDYEMVKLGVPTFMGYLYRAGHTECEHWDFDAHICETAAIDDTAFDLRQYFDEELVRGFLSGTDDTLRAQTERLLDTLGVTRKAIYGLSLSAVLDRIANVMALGRVTQCIAKVLRERYPECTIVLGGLQASPDSLHPEIYRELLEGCPAIDLAWIGAAEHLAVQLYRNVLRGEHAKNRTLSTRVLFRDEQGRVCRGVEGNSEVLDADLRDATGLRKGLAVHTQTTPLTDQTPEVASEKLVAAIDLVRRKHVEAEEGSRAADFDAVDLDAREAGAHAYDEIPAAVPVFDPKLVDHFRYTGAQIMKRFHFDKEKLLRFSRFEGEQIVVLPHIFVRGCNAPCGFCSYAYSKIEGEDLEQTIAGLRFLSETYECKHFHFLNTQINSVYRYAEMFCDRLVETGLDILWSDCCNMRALDEKLLEKMRRAGAMRLVFGVEAPEDEMLRMIHKGINVERIERLLRASHDLGIWNHMLLIAGMPHETKAKQDRMMDFLERTAETVDFYSVSSFYLIASSPWGRDPAKFGIERISDPNNLLEAQAFNEASNGKFSSDGLRWPEKKQQIVDSTARFYSTIARAKGQSRCAAGNIDLYMLMFLYRTLGHDAKAEIVKIYTETSREIFGDSPAATLPPTRLRIQFPYIARRVNEADQSALISIPIDIEVTPAEDDGPGFAVAGRWRLAWTIPNAQQLADRVTRGEKEALDEHIKKQVQRLSGVVGPFATALDRRLGPATAERMVELLASNLRRYQPFVNEGFNIVGVGKRAYVDRALEWSGLSRSENV
jgi:MoaA/NifB/PqqE/SkfB family radical SAM enzyme/radical SAM superfamily enzyme YgiQ (UPF0313 family)